jgi:hypothetical protein
MLNITGLISKSEEAIPTPWNAAEQQNTIKNKEHETRISTSVIRNTDAKNNKNTNNNCNNKVKNNNYKKKKKQMCEGLQVVCS